MDPEDASAIGCECRFVISSTRDVRTPAAPRPNQRTHSSRAAPQNSMPEPAHGKRKHPCERPPTTLSQDPYDGGQASKRPNQSDAY